MSDSGKPCCSSPKQVLITFAIFALFGFLALILTGNLGSRTPENRAALGEFSQEVTQQRWANLSEVKEAQSAAVDSAKVDAALAALIKSPAKPAATQIVVPGSPTFLKQMEQPAAPAEAPKPAEAKPEAAAPAEQASPTGQTAPASPADSPAAPAPAAAPKPEAAAAAPAEKPAAPAPAPAAAEEKK
ncbi:MAG TPA: hypothetical protein PLA50_00750 [Bacteroidia bacterium]|nr:hypothetical protein [Bacteroidia bacterium]